MKFIPMILLSAFEEIVVYALLFPEPLISNITTSRRT